MKKGDQVMVGFEYGNPHCPFVMGSMFHKTNASQVSNDVRSITTKSGHTIVFDDTEKKEKIIIKDKDGSVITFDTQQKSLLVHSAETMEFSAKNIKLNAQENVEIMAKKGVNTIGEEIALKGENKFNVSAKDINLLGSEKFRAYGSKNTLLGKNGIELGAPNITTKLSGYSGVAKSEANKTKQNVAQITKHNAQVAQQQKTEEEKAAQRQQEEKDTTQLQINFNSYFANYMDDYIHYMTQWQTDITSENENESITVIKDVVRWATSLFKANVYVTVGSNIALTIGEKMAILFGQMNTVSSMDFSHKLLDLLTDIKNGKEIERRDMTTSRSGLSERDDVFKNFLFYAQSKGAKTTQDYNKNLTPFFEQLRASYLPSKFYREITMAWIYASKDGMDWGAWDYEKDGYTAGFVRIKCTKNWDKRFSYPERKTIWVVDEFFIDDASNPKGLLKVLKSKYFNNGKKNIFELPIAIHLSLTPLQGHWHETPIQLWRNKRRKWEDDSQKYLKDSLYLDFMNWVEKTNLLDLDKLNLD